MGYVVVLLIKELQTENLNDFDLEETKRNIKNYFKYFDKLQWQLAKLNAQKGLTANYDFDVEYKKLPYIPIGKDDFKLY